MNFSRQIFNTTVDYPNRYREKYLPLYAFILLALIFVFLYLFMPFGVNNSELKFSYPVICVLHALVPALIFYLYFTFLNYSRKNADESGWNLKKEFLHLAVLFLLMGNAAFFLRALIYSSPDNLSFYHWWIEVRNVFLLGGLIYTYLVFARFYFKPVVHTEVKFAAITFSSDMVTPHIFIKAHVKIDDFYFNPHDLLFAKAEGNYITLTILTNSGIKTELKRISLKQFEQQVTDYPNLIRCHRAYLLNIQQVIKFSGNSQGYTTFFNGTADKVPVSRAYLDIFDQTYRQLSIA